MADAQVQFLDVGAGAASRRIAYRKQPGGVPGLLWLQGFKSDMSGTKAEALSRWAGEKELAFLRFDYSGHGQSEGRFEDGTIGRWLEEAHHVFTRLTAGPQIVVGSSMGGHIALLLLKQLMAEARAAAARVKALVLIAPAWDMTEELMWKQFPDAIRQALVRDGVWLRPSQYGDPYPITRQLIEEGRHHLLARRSWDPGRPVYILHGLLDPDVPWEHTLELKTFLSGDRVHVTAVPDGEHRLSRPEDLQRLYALIEGAIAATA
jgi:pimeloyl-ACP methyl ester carboxylesterase